MFFWIMVLILIIVPLFINLAVREEKEEVSNGLLGVATLAAGGAAFLISDHFNLFYTSPLYSVILFFAMGLLPMIIVSIAKRKK